jgi:hypothetical protein
MTGGFMALEYSKNGVGTTPARRAYTKLSAVAAGIRGGLAAARPATGCSRKTAARSRGHRRRRMTAEISVNSSPTGNGSMKVKATLTNGFA